MSLPALAAEEQIDVALQKRIFDNNPNLIEDLEQGNLHIHRFNKDLVIAIAKAKNQPLQGKVGTTYPAYPVDSTGKICKGIHLIAKIIERASPQAHETIAAEAYNGNKLFSSSAAKNKNGGMLLMSEVPGIPLLNLIGTPALNNLTPLQRILLCIRVLQCYTILHKAGIFHRDVTAGNILIDLDAQRAMPIDIDPSHQTELTKAPEKTISAQSDLFSIALDILIPILSGVRPCRDTNGNTLNTEEIEDGIDRNFGELADNILALLSKLTSDNPDERGSLEEARQTFLSIDPDILISIVSGVEPQRDEYGEVLNSEAIEHGINSNFGEQAIEVMILLSTLTSEDPEDITTAEDKQEALEGLEHLISTKYEKDVQQKTTEYDKQLRILDGILEDPQFKNEMQLESSFGVYPHFYQLHHHSIAPTVISAHRLAH